MGRLYTALEDLDKPDWAKKVEKKHSDLWDFILELQSNFSIPEKPSRFGFGKKYKTRVLNHKLAVMLKDILDGFRRSFEKAENSK